MTSRLIWTYGYRPFMMGGSVNYPLKAKVPCSGPYDLGKGYVGYVALAPNGSAYVAESQTGAIIGCAATRPMALEMVWADIKKATKKIMDNQIAYAREQVKRPDCLTVEAQEFWSMMGVGNKKG